MPDGVQSSAGPPTFFGNIVTANINVDQLVMEIRSVIRPHSAVMKGQKGEIVDVPLPSPDEIHAVEPIARVVLTFGAAKFLRGFLDATVPKMEENRKRGV